MLKEVLFRIINIKPHIRAYPDISFLVFIKRCDEIVADTSLATVIVLEFTERQAVIPIQSILRTEPHKPLLILQNRIDCILG